MAQVTVMIDGKAYRMACEEGQEGHLTELAAKFDRYVGHLKAQFGEIGDLRITVMAGIMVMDELSEASRRLKALEGDMENLRRNRDAVVAGAQRAEEVTAAALEEMSQKILAIAAKVSNRPLPEPN
ncbi:cell division protein ZapA [Gellertiella hungarica]|uniref:Cell division protein ZapA n=1 Tax=Gellertiella hungarica TaxID=1572859 RepID=A0A7W6J1M6_9HYPH|nr:cell division protein ZapA [Gellertiella hungarica]MBB4063151.1 cell division protein ZapA [Gellertiella hungarica]